MNTIIRVRHPFLIFFLLICAAVQLPAQMKSKSYEATGLFTAEMDSILNPVSFKNIRFDKAVFAVGSSSVWTDIAAAARIGSVYVGGAYANNTFQFFALPKIYPEMFPGAKPKNKHVASVLVGVRNLAFKVVFETHTVNAFRGFPYEEPFERIQYNGSSFSFSPAASSGIGDTAKIDRTYYRTDFDWTGFRIPLAGKVLTLKPYGGYAENRAVQSAAAEFISDSERTQTEGKKDNTTRQLRLFFYSGWGPFGLSYNFFSMFFNDRPQLYTYTGDTLQAGRLAEHRDAEQSWYQPGRTDFIHKFSAGYKPSFTLHKTLQLKIGVDVPIEFRFRNTPLSEVTTVKTILAYTDSGVLNGSEKQVTVEYKGSMKEERIVSCIPKLSAGLQWSIIPKKAVLHAGVSSQLVRYTYSHITEEKPSTVRKTATLTVASDGTKTERKEVVPAASSELRTERAFHTLQPVSVSFGMGFTWYITGSFIVDTAYSFSTDFTSTLDSLKQSNLGVAVTMKL
ncbi:TDE2508 family outer membrane beta-barrel protein [Treponema brennaborense]|uniref:Uncharacterized protein n=1 Tax=Treponema brennaborense (strain DSM 12168 / CIP 105900 / DD5/3) TaxID=906968 RepID=F4LPB4_TREBD|nr:hypothetical protein [Treponema brennaborense]AEE16976.1 hypothetical protein Trebr_1553 [Treponema brennaborense DSM 12168]